MIKTFYPIQKNESVYSYLCNLLLLNGYCAYSSFAKEVFQRPNVYIDTDYFSQFTDAFYKELKSIYPIRKLVLEHTLLKHFVRFQSNDIIKSSIRCLIGNNSYIRNIIIVPMYYSQNRYIKYCPRCIKKYEQFPFYDVCIQFKESYICPHCGSILKKTDIRSDTAHESTLKPAMIYDNDEVCLYVSSEDINYKVAKYIHNVFKESLIENNKCTINDFLSSKLPMKYRKGAKGLKRNLNLLYADIQRFYKELKFNTLTKSHCANIFKGLSKNTYEICLISFFLNISPKELARYGENTIEDQAVVVDKKIIELRKDGRTYPEIAEILNINRSTARDVYEKYKKKQII